MELIARRVCDGFGRRCEDLGENAFCGDVVRVGPGCVNEKKEMQDQECVCLPVASGERQGQRGEMETRSPEGVSRARSSARVWTRMSYSMVHAQEWRLQEQGLPRSCTPTSCCQSPSRKAIEGIIRGNTVAPKLFWGESR